MSTDPQFVQVSATSLAYKLSTLSETNLTDYWAGYFSAPDSGLGSTCSTQDVWQNVGGFYLFLDQEPTNWTDFELQLQNLRPNLGPPNELRCLWIYNVNSPVSTWQLTKLLAQSAGTGSEITWTSKQSASFIVGTYKLTLPGQSPIDFVPDANGGGIKFANSGSFYGPSGGYQFPECEIPFSGQSLGVLTGTMAITTTPGGSDLWSALNIGLLYGSEPSPPPENSDGTLSLPSGLNDDQTYDVGLSYVGAVETLYMPVFDGASGVSELGLSFDPLNVAVSSRTALSLFPSGSSPSLNFDSHLKTTKGYAIKLAPQAASGTIPDARFVFGYCPVRTNQPEDGYHYHLSPDGAFTMTVIPPSEKISDATDVDTNRLLLGLSGIEYVSLPNTTGNTMVFEGGNPAYIPLPDSDSSDDGEEEVPKALTDLAKTSYLTITPPSGGTTPVYYAQPQEAPIYTSSQESTEEPILYFNEMPAFSLTSDGTNLPTVFPVGIYAGVQDDETVLASKMENASIAPCRHTTLSNAYGTPSDVANIPQRRVRTTEDPLGVTPQGLVVELTSDRTDFEGLYLGNMPGTNYPKVDLTAVEGKFKESLQSNQLFFVAANVDILMSCTSNRYQLTEADKPYAIALGIPEATFDQVYAACGNTIYETEGDFITAITPTAGEYVPKFLQIAGILKVEMDGWTFQLSPRSWRTDPESPTIMIAKFCERSLLEMVQDPNSWNWRSVAISPTTGNSITGTQKALTDIFVPSNKEELNESYKIFYQTVLNDPSWNGFLFLNAPVDIGEMPEGLRFLTAGISLDKFYAHHIGFSQTPFNVVDGEPVLDQTAAFGLIDYVDTLDLYSDETIPLGFKTMQLNARFANASLADFSAQVELMINQLLATPLSKSDATRGNNLIINGSYQQVGDAPSYAFALTGENLFNGRDTAITSLEVLSLQLITGGSTVSAEVKTTFILMGNLRFVDLLDFDMFSYGPADGEDDSYLRYTGLNIDMSFSMATPDQQTFEAKEGDMGFDQANSLARTSSLLNNFPLSVSGLIASPNLSEDGEPATGQTPEDMGYTSISAPLDQSPMVPSWYGLVFTLDMGTFGALTGSVSFKISILAAWSRGVQQDNANVYLGMKLPGIPAFGGSFPLQGVLKLGFRNFQFETYLTDDQKLGYKLRMRRFALSVFIWSFPPGNTDIILFGEPGNPKGSLGWYAAYDSGESSSSSTTTSEIAQPNRKRLADHRNHQKLKAGRRTPPVG